MSLLPSFFSNKRLIVLLASIIVLGALIGYSIKERKQMAWPEQFAHDTVGLFQYIFNRPAHYVAGFFGTIQDIENTYKENKALKENLSDYARVKQENRDLKHDYQDLKKQMNLSDMPELSDFKKLPALVIGRSNDGWNQIVIVDKGENDGIKADMAVVTSDGLVGKIGKVSKFTSEVILLTNTEQQNQISAMSNHVYGMVEGYDSKHGTLLFQKIPIKSKVKKGQIVTTSGYSQLFPSGLPIGKITRVTTDQYGLTKIAQVQPSANFNDLNHVVIVERTARSAATDSENK
ncbi:rod shape-determining protein MreC [Terrilactibacillus tamarindi]|uniref:rod shape-determining protein MreC n=1 Tax=Terrilactibacillus tamarindi TaxID=2599694 RepID=UPI002E32B1A9|nr:rod shape-determining protein MreC [Terrilactibacillus tamarindi]